MKNGFKESIAEVINGASGGIKGIELLTRLFESGRIDPTNHDEFDLDRITELVEKEMPEFGVLQYGMKFDETTDRVKYFFYRKLGCPCPKETA